MSVTKFSPEITFLDSVIKMPLMSLPVRSVAVKCKDGHILFSPGSLLTKEDYDQLTSVTDIVGTSLFHLGGVQKAAAQFPNARIWGPKAAQKVKPEVKWTHTLGQQEWPFENEISIHELKGARKIKEFVFYHKNSKSLIVADLFFNMIHTSGIGSWIILHLFGTYKKFAVSKFWLKYVDDLNELKKSLKDLTSMSIDNIILSHGDNIISGAHRKMIDAFTERKLL